MEAAKELISHNSPMSPVTEAYRVLRTNLQYSSVDKPLKSIVVTSSGPREGKTTTITNIAAAFAQAGSKVLLADGDMRKPRLHKIFGIASGKGLSNLLVTKGNIDDYVFSTEVPNLFVMPCGTVPPNPSELLSSNAMKQFLEDACGRFDMVFFDAPPIGAVTDAAILSTICDGVILVAASGVVDGCAFLRAKELLGNVNANIIGVVLNKMKKAAGADYNYYYYYYYCDSSSGCFENKGRKRKKKKPRSSAELEA